MFKIDVLMSTYNDEKYIRESIESVLKQDYIDFEFIIIDDGSTDKTLEIIEEYEKVDERIRLIKNEKNKGLSYNLNEGVKISNADYIVRMDADDISHSNRLSTQIRVLTDNPNIDILGSYANEINEYGELIKIKKVPLNHKQIYRQLWTCPFIHPSVIFKRISIIEAGNYNKELRRRQDYDLWFRCAQKGLVFQNIDVPLIDYRIHYTNYYRKNDFKVNANQFQLGIKGSFINRLGFMSYLGVTINFISQLFPSKTKWIIRNIKDRILNFVNK